jgi:uncharacterized protein YegL
MSPNKVIEEKFEFIFNTKVREILIEVNKYMKNISKSVRNINDGIFKLIKFFNHDDASAKTLNKKVDHNKRNGQIMLREIFDILMGKPLNKERDGKKSGLMIAPQVMLTSFEVELLKELSEELKYYTINSQKAFLENLVFSFNEIQATIEGLDISVKDLDKKDLYKKFKDRAIGCYMTCPCCNHPCDADHFSFPNISIGSEGNKHKCLLGHQFRGMNGYKMMKTYQPSLRLCEELKDTNILIYKGVRITWAEFKKRFKGWDFETIHLSREQLQGHRAKFEMIWRRVGKRLCDEFGMVYSDSFRNDADADENKDYHHILVLDKSGSMTGSRWKSLQLSVKKFTTIRSQEDANDVISCITFSDSALLVYENLSPQAAACKSLGGTGGSTNYSSGLRMMSDLILKYKHSGKKFNIVFMSDGEATDDPSTMFLYIKKYFMEDIHNFWVVGYGEIGTDYLRKIAETFHGEFKNPKDQFELKNVFAEIARSQ